MFIAPMFQTAAITTLSVGLFSFVATATAAGSIAEPVMEDVPAPLAQTATPPASSGWTGGYIGGSLGHTSIDGTFNGADLFAGSPDGGSFGVHAGYNRGFGQFVLGGELQYEVMDVQEGSSFLEFDSIARAKVRFGYDAGRFMPYVTTGVAQASVSNSSFAGDDSGAFAGLGVDYKYGQKLIVGAEVLQNKFDDFDGTGVDLEATTAALRLSFSF
ncbi:Opacity protein [Loktanella atrilutea]|uniref:Opacity protein n=1 Tax=Loktanella atrilutea TaxID=366533 RepID=A0A1M5G4J2_LOKAT|nr:outer membrane beta-barrel protein [Loktanella atrilutea]SHF98646.1 Opacity protein [Loktanella atrilutea]